MQCSAKAGVLLAALRRCDVAWKKQQQGGIRVFGYNVVTALRGVQGLGVVVVIRSWRCRPLFYRTLWKPKDHSFRFAWGCRKFCWLLSAK